jgi:2-isopropylmalate synthase
MTKRIYIYDTTLRDGAQTQGIDFTHSDKISIYEDLANLGIDYIEAGWPGANPTDTQFFENIPPSSHSRSVAFGMTPQVGRSLANDPMLANLINVKPDAITLVGKSSLQQVENALSADPQDYLNTIKDSFHHTQQHVPETLFDAEHFFDGFKYNKEYALNALRHAIEGGAKWIVLCDTNGGTLTHEVAEIVANVAEAFPNTQIGIHAHNDTGQGVAISMAAIENGASMIQGTINGLGERCGNANLTTLLANINLKTSFSTGPSAQHLHKLSSLSQKFNEQLSLAPNPYAPYVGASAFAHKGGLHASGVAKSPDLYEHVKPERVGNKRKVIVSDQAGRASMRVRLEEMELTQHINNQSIDKLLNAVKQYEAKGYSFDDSDASLDIYIRNFFGEVYSFFKLIRFRVIDDHRINARGQTVVESEATMLLQVGEQTIHSVAIGKGPLNALDNAMRKALASFYGIINHIRLEDYKVRIIPPPRNSVGTDAVVRVHITCSSDIRPQWGTIGLSYNIIDASFQALSDSYNFFLFHHHTQKS